MNQSHLQNRKLAISPLNAKKQQGVISERLVTNLIAQLKQEKVVGRLSLYKGEDKGSIYFEDGEVVYSVYGNIEGRMAIIKMRGWKEGDYVFESGRQYTPSTRASSRDDMNNSVNLAPKAEKPTKTLTSPQSTNVFSEQSSRFNSSLLDDLQLEPSPMTSPTATESSGVEASFIQALGLISRQVFGPIGEIFLDDAADELALDIEALPKNKIQSLLNTMADFMDNSSKQEAFLAATDKLKQQYGY